MTPIAHPAHVIVYETAESIDAKTGGFEVLPGWYVWFDGGTCLWSGPYGSAEGAGRCADGLNDLRDCLEGQVF